MKGEISGDEWSVLSRRPVNRGQPLDGCLREGDETSRGWMKQTTGMKQTDGAQFAADRRLCGWSLHDLSYCIRIYAHLNLFSRVYFSSPMTRGLMFRFVRYPLVFHYLKWLLFNLVLFPIGAWLITDAADGAQWRAIWPQASISNGQRRREVLRWAGKWKKYNKWIMYVIVCPLTNSWQFSCRSI